MQTLIVDNQLYYLPSDEGDVCSLITMARQKNLKLRGRGAHHSVAAAVDADKDTDLRFMLSKMNKVCIDEDTETVWVQAGCHLGFDPYDPTGISTQENGLFILLDKKGWALPDMGGITHQTVGGFLSTGASGSNVKDSFGDAVVAITFIPADSDDPQPITVRKSVPADTDLFHAAGVSLGLLGIIVSVTFSLVKSFVIKGKEVITRFDDCEVDMSGAPGAANSLRTFLLKQRFKRLLWYPQPRVKKVVVWKADFSDAKEGEYVIKKYQITPYRTFRGWLPLKVVQWIAHRIYSHYGNLPERLRESLRYRKRFYRSILPFILYFFVPLDKKRGGKLDSQEFEDHWFSSLPMDNDIDDRKIPVDFTELWIPFTENGADDTVAAVLRKLNAIYDEMYAGGDGPIPAGDFCVEMVATKESDFWMSPSYKTKVFRVDVFWFGDNAGSPANEFYPIFWRGLAEFNYRCHWGKYLPDGEGDQGWRYLKPLFPKWNDFMALRKKYDPKDIFLTSYWRSHLGL